MHLRDGEARLITLTREIAAVSSLATRAATVATRDAERSAYRLNTAFKTRKALIGEMTKLQEESEARLKVLYNYGLKVS
jgi:hypothetical protein